MHGETEVTTSQHLLDASSRLIGQTVILVTVINHVVFTNIRNINFQPKFPWNMILIVKFTYFSNVGNLFLKWDFYNL